jgi:outer membrane biosynthesis protein TonB
MNEHAGASCTLSVLIVGVFAVLLHDKDRSPPRPPSGASPGVRKLVGPPAPAPAPAPPISPPPGPQPAPPARLQAPPTRTKPPIPERPAPSLEVKPAEPRRTVTPPKPRDPLVRVVQTAPPVARRPPDRPQPARSVGGFTLVEPGESLADVAARVYGSGDAAETLWKANRDQLSRPDAPLARGSLLRTP